MKTICLDEVRAKTIGMMGFVAFTRFASPVAAEPEKMTVLFPNLYANFSSLAAMENKIVLLS